jgi:anti-sigma B factor antagonist
MEITSEKLNDYLVIKIKGHLDAVTSSSASEKLSELIENGESKFILDLTDLDYISSAGLQTVLLAAKKISSQKGTFALTNLKEEVFEVFEISGFTSFLNIFDSNEDVFNE